MPHDVFISYSTKDRPMADAVCHAFESAGIRCWTAPRDATPGRHYQGSIVRAIRDCRAMVLVFSSDSNASAHVTREVSIASDEGKPVVPFRIEAVTVSDELRFYMSSVHWLDALTPPLERHIERLVDVVATLLPVADQVSQRTRRPPEGALGASPRPVGSSADTRAPGHSGRKPRPEPIRSPRPRGNLRIAGFAGLGVFAMVLVGLVVQSRSQGGADPLPPEPRPAALDEQTFVEAVNDGTQAYNAGDVAGATAHWQRANEAWDRRPEAHMYLAQMHSAQGRHGDAIDSYRAALEALDRGPGRSLTPDEETEREKSYATALYGLGALHFSAEQFADAERSFRRLADSRPKDPTSWAGRLNALHALQRWADIVPVAEHLLGLDPLNDRAHLLLVLAFRETDQPTPALAALERLQQLPVYVRELAFWGDRGTMGAVVVGNDAPRGTPIRLEFSFFGSANMPVSSRTIDIEAPAAEATTRIEVPVPTEPVVTGVEYRVLD